MDGGGPTIWQARHLGVTFGSGICAPWCPGPARPRRPCAGPAQPRPRWRAGLPGVSALAAGHGEPHARLPAWSRRAPACPVRPHPGRQLVRGVPGQDAGAAVPAAGLPPALVHPDVLIQLTQVRASASAARPGSTSKTPRCPLACAGAAIASPFLLIAVMPGSPTPPPPRSHPLPGRARVPRGSHQPPARPRPAPRSPYPGRPAGLKWLQRRPGCCPGTGPGRPARLCRSGS